MRFHDGQGLPGRVWRAKGPVWVVDVHLDENFPRRPAAKACGLHAGFGLPVRLGGEVALVLEFFSHRRLEVDPLLLQTLGQACSQLARVLERAEAGRQAEAARVELRRLVAEAEVARFAAEAASETKSRFLANMSHEIRTPLNGVLGMVQAMERGALDAVQRRRLDVVRESGEALLVILNDVLDLAKVEAGALELERTPFDLPELLASIAAMSRPTAEAKGVRLQVEADVAAPWRLGDPTRVRQLVQNLLSNALKFTDAGEVGLRLDEAEPGRVRLEVSDTGVGIAPDKCEAIFESFVQADDSITRRFGGTGLGLPICRRLARAMGGDVSVRSRPGAGSTFSVELDLPACIPPVTTAKMRTQAVSSDTSLRVLAAEDNPTNRLVLQTLLADPGLELVLASDGRQAVEAWRGARFDLILMDVQMPVLDGLGAVRLIRDEEAASGRARTPILALTANTMTHQAAGYLAAGMDGVVAKPIQVGALFEAMEQALAQPPSPAEAAGGGGPAHLAAAASTAPPALDSPTLELAT